MESALRVEKAKEITANRPLKQGSSISRFGITWAVRRPLPRIRTVVAAIFHLIFLLISVLLFLIASD